MSNTVPISEQSKSIIYQYPLIKQRSDMGFVELRKYTDNWRTFERVWMYNYTVRDLLKQGIINSYYIFASSSELQSYKAGQGSHASMYPSAAANGVFDDIIHSIPDTPVWISAVAGDKEVTVKWTVPPSNESPILSYTITSYDISNNQINTIVSSSPPSSPSPLPSLPSEAGQVATYIMTSLNNGTAYRFTIYATNNIGNSLTSGFTTWVKPTAVPDPPTAFIVFQGDNSFNASWTVPFNEGSVITRYAITVCDASNNPIYDGSHNLIYDASNNPIHDASNNPIYDNSNNLIQIIFINTITQGNTATYNIPAIIKYKYDASGNHLQYSLNLGTLYSFKISAFNIMGSSPLVALMSPVKFIRVPVNAPTNLSATYSNVDTTLTFTFTQIQEDLSMSTSYTFTSDPVGVFRTVIASATVVDVNGNIVASVKGVPPTTYTFTVYASAYSLGNSPASLPSNSVIVTA